MGLDAVVTLVSLFGPKILDLVKGVIHRKDSPEATLASMAQTAPDKLAEYVNAQASLITAQNLGINADITGTVSVWVSNTRAMIRPFITIVALIHIIYANIAGIIIPDAFVYTYEGAIGSWFGSRLK